MTFAVMKHVHICVCILKQSFTFIVVRFQCFCFLNMSFGLLFNGITSLQCSVLVVFSICAKVLNNLKYICFL